MAKVGIIGMGYVGKGMLRLFQRAHDVTWYDIETQPVREEVMGVDLAVICVPTPMRDDGSCDTSIVEEVASWVDAPLVLVKSTVTPGTMDRLNAEDKLEGAWARFHFSPEYMGEPRNFVPEWKYPDPRHPHKHDFCIVGGMRAGDVLDLIVPCMGPNTRFMSVSSTEAELTKYMENAYFALKVSFVTEFRRLAALFDVDWYALRALWLLDPRVEPDHTLAFAEDPGWGGKCLPKDVAALCHAATELGSSSPLLEMLQEVNAIHRGPRRQFDDAVESSGDKLIKKNEGLAHAVTDCQREKLHIVVNPDSMYSGKQVQALISQLNGKHDGEYA